jgi:hypothetical protein
MSAEGASFKYSDLPRIGDFSAVLTPESFTDLSDDWVLGLSDVVASRDAIAEGRYKAVNMAGAAVISAVMNALEGSDYPFVFGGDGAAVALPGELRETLERALIETACWVRDDLGLGLRVAVVTVAETRAAGRNVQVARFAESDAVDYAMFAGGGLDWAEKRMKAGESLLPVPTEKLRPDLTGLSCRWEPSESRAGVILSLIVAPSEGADMAAFREELKAVLSLAQEAPEEGHPVPREGARFHWPPSGLGYEAAAAAGGWLASRLSILAESALGWILFKTGWRFGGFDPNTYRRYVMLNSDYRKFDDGLKMTVDCSRETSRALSERLEKARAAGLLRYGLFEQDSALMTCIVPSVSSNRHFHFMDGSAGGYAAAADRMDRL